MRCRAGGGCRRYVRGASAVDHEEDEVPLETGQREHFDGKEVGSREAGPVCEQERLPRRALTPLGGRVDPVILQDPLHRVPGDLVTEVGKRTLDPCVAPLRILARHTHYELSDLSERHRAASPSSRTAVVLLGDQPPVPAEDRVRGDDTGHLHQCAPAKSLAAHCESTALGVSEPKRSRTKLLAEDAILLSEIVDQIVLVAIHPASKRKYEELQRMGHRERLLGRDGRHRIGRSDSPGLGRFFRTLRGRDLAGISDRPTRFVEGCSRILEFMQAECPGHGEMTCDPVLESSQVIVAARKSPIEKIALDRVP
jgi:hypothetical protein